MDSQQLEAASNTPPIDSTSPLHLHTTQDTVPCTSLLSSSQPTKMECFSRQSLQHFCRPRSFRSLAKAKGLRSDKYTTVTTLGDELEEERDAELARGVVMLNSLAVYRETYQAQGPLKREFERQKLSNLTPPASSLLSPQSDDGTPRRDTPTTASLSSSAASSPTRHSLESWASGMAMVEPLTLSPFSRTVASSKKRFSNSSAPGTLSCSSPFPDPYYLLERDSEHSFIPRSVASLERGRTLKASNSDIHGVSRKLRRSHSESDIPSLSASHSNLYTVEVPIMDESEMPFSLGLTLAKPKAKGTMLYVKQIDPYCQPALVAVSVGDELLSINDRPLSVDPEKILREELSSLSAFPRSSLPSLDCSSREQGETKAASGSTPQPLPRVVRLQFASNRRYKVIWRGGRLGVHFIVGGNACPPASPASTSSSSLTAPFPTDISATCWLASKGEVRFPVVSEKTPLERASSTLAENLNEVAVGDELLLINGAETASMSFSQLMRTLGTSPMPIELVFRRKLPH